MYHGADHSSHLLAKIGGFLLLPAAGGLLTAVAAPAVEGVAPKANPGIVAAAVGTLAYGAVAYACYKASESDHLSETMQSLFRGGMWGAGIAAAFTAAAPAVSPPGPAVSGPSPKVDKAFNLLTAKAAGAVAAKRHKKKLALRK